MKPLLFLAAAALSLSGCTSGSKCDTGDSACGSSSDELLIQSMDGSCSGASCTWSVLVNGEFGQVELDLVETGDPTSTCGPGAKDINECGVWAEFHNDFSTSDFNNPGEAAYEEKSISLALEDNFENQVNNVSTLFDVSDSTISNQLSVMFTVYDKSGAYLDCAVYGHDPSFFSEYCTNNADNW